MLHVFKCNFLKRFLHTTSTRDTNRCTTATLVSHTKCLEAFCVRNGAISRETVRHREDGSSRHEYQEDRRDGRGASENDKAVAALAAPRRRAGVAQLWATTRRLHRAAERHSAKTRHQTSHLTLHGSLHRHRQHGPGAHFSSPENRNGALPGSIFCCFQAPRKWWKKHCKKRGVQFFSKKIVFAVCTFHEARSRFIKNACCKQHAFWVDPLGVSNDFRSLKLLCFF